MYIDGNGNIATNNVTDMCDMFRGCSSLTSLDLSNFNTNKVTTMIGMFRECSSLTSLNLSNFNTNDKTIMHHMFDGKNKNCNLICSDKKILDAFNKF